VTRKADKKGGEKKTHGLITSALSLGSASFGIYFSASAFSSTSMHASTNGLKPIRCPPPQPKKKSKISYGCHITGPMKCPS